MKVYLAGPITGLTYDKGQDWRAYATEKLAEFGLSGYSPLRGKEYLKTEGVLKGAYDKAPQSTSKGIMGRDRNDVMTCDAVIMNLAEASAVSIGTMIEIGWADAFRKPLILVMELGNVHEHPMVNEGCIYRVHALDDAIALAKVLLCK